MPSGDRIELTDDANLIGRLADCDGHHLRRQHQPPPRPDHPLRQRLRDRRPRLDQRHVGQRRTPRSPTIASPTATSSPSAPSASASRPRDPNARRDRTTMTDQVLDVLKLVLLALLYLFFARVLWAVWSEVRQPANARHVDDRSRRRRRRPRPPAWPSRPVDASTKPAKGRGGTPARLVDPRTEGTARHHIRPRAPPSTSAARPTTRS